MVKTNNIETFKLQTTVDSTTDRVIGDIAILGFQGISKSEVVRSILRMWLWENQEKLRQSGIRIPESNIKNG